MVLEYVMGAGVLALLFAGWLAQNILKLPMGNDKMVEIARAIQEGSSAYLKQQYRLGAFLSALAGYVGMNVSVRSNSRTAWAADSGMDAALKTAFRGGSVTGMV